MNEFEWLRQMRALNTPEPPGHDLWPSIHSRLPARAPRARRVWPWALAASFILALLLTGGLGLQQLQQRHARLAAVATARHAPPKWHPEDPRLSGAAVELYAAREELRMALQQAPHDASLRRLAHRTRMQETQLRRLDNEAG